MGQSWIDDGGEREVQGRGNLGFQLTVTEEMRRRNMRN